MEVVDIHDIAPGSRAVLGFSGGVDSVVLSHVLLAHGIRPYLLHVNYGLRPEADEDEKWCQWYADEYRFELIIHRANPDNRRDQNIQNWARDVRYKFFSEQAEAIGADYIFTAHHLDDRKETFFMNALRGAGLQGLNGYSNTAIRRPLSRVSKSEILAHAEKLELPWREDASNAANKYTRNKVRNVLMPILDQVEPRHEGGLKKTLLTLEQERLLLDSFYNVWHGEFVSNDGPDIRIAFGSWCDMDGLEALFHRLLRAHRVRFSSRDLEVLFKAETGHWLEGGTHVLLKDRQAYILTPKPVKDTHVYTIAIPEDLQDLPFKMDWSEATGAAEHNGRGEAGFDAETLNFPFVIRTWKNGDSFIPLGMNGHKKVADFLNDEGVPRHRKINTYVLEYQGKIAWVMGYRISNEFKVAPTTSKTYLATLK